MLVLHLMLLIIRRPLDMLLYRRAIRYLVRLLRTRLLIWNILLLLDIELLTIARFRGHYRDFHLQLSASVILFLTGSIL
jgi:hypothetical protein